MSEPDFESYQLFINVPPELRVRGDYERFAQLHELTAGSRLPINTEDVSLRDFESTLGFSGHVVKGGDGSTAEDDQGLLAEIPQHVTERT